MKRQSLRKLILIISLLLFPVTLYYLSPYLIIQGAMEGIITGSFIVFTAMLLGSIFLGRVFCGFLCPAGELQECAALINGCSPKQGWRNNIKYGIWLVWLLFIIYCLVKAGNIAVHFFYMTNHGISVSDIHGFIIYYVVIILIFIPCVMFGRRIFCHYFCWMAPFMVFGRKIAKLMNISRLGLTAKRDACINCRICDKSCPMSLKVCDKVQLECMEDSECILCGACVDSCPKKAISYKFGGK